MTVPSKYKEHMLWKSFRRALPEDCSSKKYPPCSASRTQINKNIYLGNSSAGHSPRTVRIPKVYVLIYGMARPYQSEKRDNIAPTESISSFDA